MAIIIPAVIVGIIFLYQVIPKETEMEYSKYGISFTLPAEAEITERGFWENEPNEQSGEVFCSWDNSHFSFDICWINLLEGSSFDMEDLFEWFEEKGKLEDVRFLNAVRGSRGESTFKERTLYYTLVEGDVEGQHCYGILAISYIGDVFIFCYWGEDTNSLQGLQGILETLEI